MLPFKYRTKKIHEIRFRNVFPIDNQEVKEQVGAKYPATFVEVIPNPA